MKRICLRGLFGLLLVGTLVRACADVMTNLHPVADTSLFESDPNNNLGGWTDLPAGTTFSRLRSRGLLKFDLTQIPPNATVLSASLAVQLVKKSTVGVGSTMGLNRMLSSWVEGGGSLQIGELAKPGQVTWNNRAAPSTPWGIPGGAAGTDFVTTASSSVSVDALGSYTFISTPVLVADVQMWINNPGTNFGWMLLCQSEATGATARRFASRESTHPPVLTLQYSAPAAATPPSLSNPALVADQIQFSFNAESNRPYAVEAQGAFNPQAWVTLTNIPAQSSPFTILVSDAITNSSRCYRVRTP